MQRSSTLIVFAAAMVTGGLALPNPGAASPYAWLRGGKAEHVTVRINHHDLDLSNPADVRRLRQRIRAEIRRICSENDHSPVQVELERGRCMREAIRAADAAVTAAQRAQRWAWQQGRPR